MTTEIDTMDIRIARLLMLVAHQSHDAASTLLAQHEAVIKQFGAEEPEPDEAMAAEMADIKRKAEESLPTLRAAQQQAIDAMDALTEIVRDHKAALAGAAPEAGTVQPPEPTGDGSQHKH